MLQGLHTLVQAPYHTISLTIQGQEIWIQAKQVALWTKTQWPGAMGVHGVFHCLRPCIIVVTGGHFTIDVFSFANEASLHTHTHTHTQESWLTERIHDYVWPH